MLLPIHELVLHSIFIYTSGILSGLLSGSQFHTCDRVLAQYHPFSVAVLEYARTSTLLTRGTGLNIVAYYLRYIKRETVFILTSSSEGRDISKFLLVFPMFRVCAWDLSAQGLKNVQGQESFLFALSVASMLNQDIYWQHIGSLTEVMKATSFIRFSVQPTSFTPKQSLKKLHRLPQKTFYSKIRSGLIL